MKQQPPSPFRPTPAVATLNSSALDVMGDLHGCAAEAQATLQALGHSVVFPKDVNEPALVTFAPGRKVAFLGDITDRGPRSVDTLRLVEGTLLAGGGCVMGNHDSKLLRTLAGHKVNVGNGLEQTLEQLESVAPETRDRWRDMILGLPHQIKAPDPMSLGQDGWITLVHGAAPEHHQDQANKNSMNRAHYGYADGTTDSHGNLIREDWAATYKGPRAVLHGHTPIGKPSLKNRVSCLDTGAVFGGHMSALSTDTLVVTQVPSGVCAKERPGVTRATIAMGDPIQTPLSAFTRTKERGLDR